MGYKNKTFSLTEDYEFKLKHLLSVYLISNESEIIRKLIDNEYFRLPFYRLLKNGGHEHLLNKENNREYILRTETFEDKILIQHIHRISDNNGGIRDEILSCLSIYKKDINHLLKLIAKAI